MKKLAKPINPLIFNVAASMAAEWAEAAFVTPGLTRGKYVGLGDKPVKMFVKDHFEKFVPMAISTLIEMLKPTSNCTEHMRMEIYEALMDPMNDPDLMDMGRNKTKQEQEQMLQNAIKNYDKRKVKFELKSNILLNQTEPKKDLKGSSALN